VRREESAPFRGRLSFVSVRFDVVVLGVHDHLVHIIATNTPRRTARYPVNQTVMASV